MKFNLLLDDSSLEFEFEPDIPAPFQFWSVWTPCDSQFEDAVQYALEQMDVVKRLVDKHSDDMAFVTTAAGKTNS